MFVPSSKVEALVLLVVSLCCWGSWAITAKLAHSTYGTPVHVWYVVFCVSVLGWSAAAGPGLGSDWFAADTRHRDFVQNLQTASVESIAYASAGGAMISVANGILIYMVARVG